MTVNLDRFSRDLDQLFEGRPIPVTDPALQAATAMLALDLNAEAKPPADLRIRWVSHTKAVTMERKSFMQTLRARPLMALLIALLILLILSGVAYALGHALGYLPGFGLIEQGVQIRVLKEPVSITRDGITVTVKSAILTPERTDIRYFVSSVPRSAYPEGEAVTGGCIGEASEPYLLLPDQTKINEGRFLTTAVPVKVNEAVFIIPCIFNTLPGTVPENWQLTLQFVPAPPELTVIPVTEMLPTAQANTAEAPANPLVLTKVLDIGNSFVLMGEFRYDMLGTVAHDNVFTDGSWWWLKGAKVTDSIGSEIPSMVTSDIEWPTPGPNTEVWVYQLDKNFVPPVTLAYKTEHVIPVGAEEQAEFEFDAGPNPKDGNAWTIDKDFKLGGYNIRLVSISLSREGYNFNFKGDPGASANAISVDIAGHPPYCGGGGGGEEFPQEFTVSVCYGGVVPFPNGKLDVVIHFQALRREDKAFQLEWSPAEPYATPTPQPGVCLTLEKWNQLADRDDQLPAGLGGKILTTVNEGGLWPAIYISTLDSSVSTRMGTATWPSLSVDGSHIAYSVDDGIHVHDLTNGENHAIGADGYRIIWSPDNTRMMYTDTSHLFVVNVNGSGLRQITTVASQVISPTGWIDNQTIVYAVMGGDGFIFTSYNLESGETKTLSTIQNKAGYGAISPDGQWIVFADHIVGEVNWGIFISRLDGSERNLVVEPQVPTSFSSVWSPDGQWLIVNTKDAKERDRAVLVNPFTCQVFSLHHFNGPVEGWSP